MKPLKYILIVLWLAVLVTTFGSALSYSINNKLEFTVTSNNATGCNVTTMSGPLGITFINQVMTKTSNTFNSTIAAENFTNTGEYCFDIICSDSINIENGNRCFNFSPSGVTQSTSQGIGSAIFLILMIALTAGFIIIGLSLWRNETFKILGLFFIFFSALLLVYDVWLGQEYYINYTGMTNGGVPQIIFTIFMWITLAGLLITLALLFTRWKEVFKWFKKELKRKEGDQDEDIEDWDLSKFSGKQTYK
jgi:uncharacterized membrane protein